MRPLLLLLTLVLAVGCPKEKPPTSSVDPAASLRWFAIFIADDEGVSPPESMTVEAKAASGQILFAEAPALLVDQPPEGWRRWARIGDAEARARLGSPGWLLASAAAGNESASVYLSLTQEAAADPEIRAKLQNAGIAIHTIAGDVVTATVPRGAWGALLGLEQVVAVEAAGTVGKKGG